MTDAAKGRLAVAAQFALIAWLLWPASPPGMSIAALVLLAAGVLLAVWTLAWNRPGNFNIRPEPRPDGSLVTGGPYAWIRHPMYTSLLLFMAAAPLAYADLWKWLAWSALVLVLWLKSRLEERALAARYPGYAAYAERAGRFLPGL